MTQETTRLNNDHVIRFYRFMHWLSERQRAAFAQLHYYTLLNKELNPHWTPEQHDAR